MQHQMQHQIQNQIQKGFTLIELVVVIIVLGILSAVALPRFMNTAGDARVAVMKAVEGTLRSTNSMLYAKAAANGQENAVLYVVTLPSSAKVVLQYGYAINLSQLLKAVELNPIADFVLPSTDELAGAKVLQYAKASNPDGCEIEYTAPNTAGQEPIYTSNYSSSLNGC